MKPIINGPSLAIRITWVTNSHLVEEEKRGALMRSYSYLFFYLIFSFSQISTAQTPPGVRVQNIQAVGSGCPNGSYSATISPDGQAFSVLLDNFVASSTMQNPISRLSCQLKINFEVPRGWTFAVFSADYRGYAYAEPGTMAVHQALYSFDGSQPRNERPGYQNGGTYSFRSQEFHGPYNDNYFIHYDLDHRLAPWAPCNNDETQTLFVTTFLMSRNLNLSSSLNAQITLDSIDGKLQSQNYQLGWRTCTPSTTRPAPPDNTGDPGRQPNPGRPPRYPFR
ncbi:MAG: DUF4360 domain-containing protein [Pseudobdellovibrionaceae bacterium]